MLGSAQPKVTWEVPTERGTWWQWGPALGSLVGQVILAVLTLREASAFPSDGQDPDPVRNLECDFPSRPFLWARAGEVTREWDGATCPCLFPCPFWLGATGGLRVQSVDPGHVKSGLP